MVSDAECEEKAIAWCKLTAGTVSFTLTEETEVSLGIIVNLTGQSSFGINAFKLEGVTIEPLAPSDPTGIKAPTFNSQFPILNTQSIYDLSGRKIVNGKWLNGKLPKGIYIQNGKKLLK